MKLFCLAYAGGTATTAYQKMKSRLYPRIDVVPVNIPGRVEKDTSPPKTVDELIGRLSQQICSKSDEDWAILGHSYGAGLAFEIARRAEKGGNPPRLCIISGRRAPKSNRQNHSFARLDDDTLLTRVAEWGALPPEYFAHPALRSLAAARLREDFQFSDSLHERDPMPLRYTPLYVMAGTNDPVAPPREVSGWCSRTLTGSSFDKFEGDHFFLFNNHKAADSIRTHLSSCLSQHA